MVKQLRRYGPPHSMLCWHILNAELSIPSQLPLNSPLLMTFPSSILAQTLIIPRNAIKNYHSKVGVASGTRVCTFAVLVNLSW
jgi:hypothetical protein